MERVLAAGLAALILATAASAATIRGSARGERLVGTAGADTLLGLAGADTVHALGGGDFVDPGAGPDEVRGGDGPDRISLETDGVADRVLCGAGRDIVTADERDVVRGSSCEVVTRRLSRDPFRGGPGQHATEAEPDSFAWGNTIVTVFQISRILGGGAMDIGFATSTNGGVSWRSGRLPGVGVNSSPPGRAARVSDPVVAYDAGHGTWLAATLAVSPGLTELLVSRSPDGLAWSAPVVAATSGSTSLAFDKEWITCDSWSASPRRGRCYLSYTDVNSGRLLTQSSADGGVTWGVAVITAAVGTGPEAFVTGAQPVVRPDGSLVVLFWDPLGIGAARSVDGGRTFGPVTRVNELRQHAVTGMRAPPLPSVEVAGDGTVYTAWHDCRFRQGCRANDIVLASSADGLQWSAPRRVSAGASGSYADRFLPGLAVDPASSGPHRLAVVHYSMPTTLCSERTCTVDVDWAVSRDGGRTWTRRRLSARSMRLLWIGQSNAGHMLADYLSASFVTGRPVPVFVLSSPPVGRQFRQAVYSARAR